MPLGSAGLDNLGIFLFAYTDLAVSRVSQKPHGLGEDEGACESDVKYPRHATILM